jgi:hypothetical protein
MEDPAQEEFGEIDLKPIKATLTTTLIYTHNLQISGIDWDFFHPPKAKVSLDPPGRIFLVMVGFKFP